MRPIVLSRVANDDKGLEKMLTALSTLHRHRDLFASALRTIRNSCDTCTMYFRTPNELMTHIREEHR